jgi:YVTN family beta-propeller protein
MRLFSLLFGTSLAIGLSPDASAYLAYVSNEKSNTISVIDTDKLAVVKTIKVGQRPRGIGLTKDGNSSWSASATTTRSR